MLFLSFTLNFWDVRRSRCSYNVEHCSSEEILAVNEVDVENFYEFGRLGEKTLSPDEKSNKGWLEDEFTRGKTFQTCFTVCLL